MAADEGEWEPRKSAWTVTVRRFKRRLKAAASVGLALAAGTFLALQGDARADSSVPDGKGANKSKGKGKDDSKKSDDPKKKKAKDKGEVDKEEHRKGMPVRDNLLE